MAVGISKRSRESEILEITRKVCIENSIPFSVNDATQVLADVSIYANECDDAMLLNAVGQRVGVRFREMLGDFDDLVLAVMDAGPVVLSCDDNSVSEGWNYVTVLKKTSRGRFRVFYDEQERTVSNRWLRNVVGNERRAVIRWYLVQRQMTAASASSQHYPFTGPTKPLSPMRRLAGLLQPDMKDIRTVMVFAIFVGILSLTTPLAVEALVNTIAFGRYLQPLLVLSLMVFIFLAFRAGLGVLMTVVVEIIQRRLFVRAVDDLALRLTRVPIPFLNANYGPELVNRFFDIVSVQKITSKLLLESLMLVLQTAVGLTVLAFYHPFLLGYDIALITLMAVVLIIMGRGAVKTAQNESTMKYETAAWLQELVRHPTTFKFNGGLAYAINRADELAGQYIQARRAHFKILMRQVTFSMLMQAVAATVLLGLGGYLVIDGQMTLGQLVAAELIVTVILGSFAKIGKDLESFYDLLAAVDKLGQLFDLPTESSDKLELSFSEGAASISLVDLQCGSGRPTTNLTVEPGTSAAIFGDSGTGKTEIIETIAGIHTPSKGHVLVNDFRVDLIGTESLQSRLGFVREIEIFAGTIDENLRMGRTNISSAAINEIIEIIGLNKTIANLEEGINTELSVSGHPLSSGQAARLVLARALVVKPQALLIDGLLDGLSDRDIRDIVNRLATYAGQTTIVIATGRKSIAQWANQVLELSTVT